MCSVMLGGRRKVLFPSLEVVGVCVLSASSVHGRCASTMMGFTRFKRARRWGFFMMVADTNTRVRGVEKYPSTPLG